MTARVRQEFIAGNYHEPSLAIIRAVDYRVDMDVYHGVFLTNANVVTTQTDRPLHDQLEGVIE